MEKKTKQSNKVDSKRERLLWSVLIPQFILLAVSIVWINVSPKDNVFKYFTFSFEFLFLGIAVGITLAIAGYLFYLFAKKTKRFPAAIELFEQMLAPTFSNFKTFDLIALSFIAGFCEEIFFRGLVLPAFGIIISSIAFGMLHFPGKRFWIYALWATLSGLLLGFLFTTSNSLWVPITAHSVNNVIGMFMLRKIKASNK